MQHFLHPNLKEFLPKRVGFRCHADEVKRALKHRDETAMHDQKHYG